MVRLIRERRIVDGRLAMIWRNIDSSNRNRYGLFLVPRVKNFTYLPFQELRHSYISIAHRLAIWVSNRSGPRQNFQSEVPLVDRNENL